MNRNHRLLGEKKNPSTTKKRNPPRANKPTKQKNSEQQETSSHKIQFEPAVPSRLSLRSLPPGRKGRHHSPPLRPPTPVRWTALPPLRALPGSPFSAAGTGGRAGARARAPPQCPAPPFSRSAQALFPRLRSHQSSPAGGARPIVLLRQKGPCGKRGRGRCPP